MSDDTKPRCPFGFDAAPGTPDAQVFVTPAMARDKLPTMTRERVEPGAEGKLTGRCLCGVVSFSVDTAVSKVFANHDEASRRWSGGIGLTLVVRATNTTFCGWGNIVHYAHTERERHCFCRVCGSSLFVRHVAPPALDGMLSVSAGALDHPLRADLVLAAETAIDAKPAYYALAGERRRLTQEEVEAMVAPRTAQKTAAE